MTHHQYFVLFVLLLGFVAPAASQTIWSTMSNTPGYEFLRVEFNRRTSYVAVLSSPSSNVTLLAPSEDAMYDALPFLATLPNSEVSKILGYHILTGALPFSYLATQYVIQSAYAPPSMGNRPQRILVSSDGGTPRTYLYLTHCKHCALFF